MTLVEFNEHIKNKEKPEGMNPYLEAMYEDALGHWDRAHDIIQDIPGIYGNWIHAYLHRKEGDHWNARYWYTNAGKPRPNYDLEQEWKEIATELLKM